MARVKPVLGVTCISVDPYQIGHENEEAVKSGAYWFYRKLGFKSMTTAMAIFENEDQATELGLIDGT